VEGTFEEQPLFNNAGSIITQPFLEVDEEDGERQAAGNSRTDHIRHRSLAKVKEDLTQAGITQVRSGVLGSRSRMARSSLEDARTERPAVTRQAHPGLRRMGTFLHIDYRTTAGYLKVFLDTGLIGNDVAERYESAISSRVLAIRASRRI